MSEYLCSEFLNFSNTCDPIPKPFDHNSVESCPRQTQQNHDQGKLQSVPCVFNTLNARTAINQSVVKSSSCAKWPISDRYCFVVASQAVIAVSQKNIFFISRILQTCPSVYHSHPPTIQLSAEKCHHFVSIIRILLLPQFVCE